MNMFLKSARHGFAAAYACKQIRRKISQFNAEIQTLSSKTVQSQCAPQVFSSHSHQNLPFAYSMFTFSFNRQTLSSHVLNDNFAPKDAFLIVFCYLCSSKKSFIYT